MKKNGFPNISIKNKKAILKLFSQNYWFVPSDVFLRSAESMIWRSLKFEAPVLSIGCGDSYLDKFIFGEKTKLDVGIDIDKKSIDIAKSVNFYKEVELMDATKMHFKDASFQIVISNSTFEHIKEDEKAVCEVSRIIRKEGFFMFTVPCDNFDSVIKDIIKDEREYKNFNDRLAHFHYRSLSEWEKVLNDSNFEIADYKYYFPRESLIVWYQLLKLATFKIKNRELWSYLRDSKLNRLLPKRIIESLVYKYLDFHFSDNTFSDGCFLFIKAKKRK